MSGKKTLINIGNGAVLSDAIAAILRPTAESPRDTATIVLKGGGHLPTDRTFDDLSTDIEEAFKHSPLTEFVPEIAAAMHALQGTFPGPPEMNTDSATHHKTPVAGHSKKS